MHNSFIFPRAFNFNLFQAVQPFSLSRSPKPSIIPFFTLTPALIEIENQEKNDMANQQDVP